MSIILFIHNFLIGFSMCNSFLSSNRSFKTSLSLTVLSSLPAYLLAIIGYFISTFSINEIFVAVMFSISSGSLLYVLIIELLPQVFKEYKSKFSFIYILIGILFCGTLIFLHVH